MKRRVFTSLIAGISIATGLFSTTAFAQEKNTIKVGVSAGVHAEIFEQVKKVAAKEGLNIQIVEFNDYVQPNAALDAGDIDANSFQHLPYLENEVKHRGYKITNAGLTVTFPMVVYSHKIKSLNDLKSGDTIGIPNDPSNEGRALLILQANKVITLKPSAGLTATPLDIASNPKKIKFSELDAAQLPRSLDDFAAAVINDNYAETAGLSSAKEGIAVESAQGPYANLIAIRTADKDKPWVKKLLKAYYDPSVKAFIVNKYKQSAIPAW